ncbi:DUF116 domain-containing protein [Methanimicrococcus blatticola]|uniref:DUF116 domain-containing protein n=1 Tax=Methanimicrococcus blatticola TaxID=91560 RepID=A0A484F3T4_9EURY|nr:DUF116 domain-containing protein [Methanimicrococcus blatticola]MBZ3936007.1 DUF116 domain-containing protein [Methanimicrococcus blatticola]MCC2509380.1 DUF116 domain-containing protein [Methanimicrococcus blatticola]TDQ68263.1 hypothetical protein C7391_1202 [Methanimicrococcus blatticola]
MYDEVGRIMVIGLVLSLILLLVAFYIGHTKLRKNAFFASYASRVLDFFYKPLLAVYMFVYKSPDKLHKKMAEIKNHAQCKKFSRTKTRIVLAPHCMRHVECKARTTRTGIQCTSCGKCDFAELKRLSEEHGYKLYIITGSSFVKHILKHPDAKGTDGVLAIGCNYEINKGMRELKRSKIMTYGVPLLSAGCYNTQIDLKEFERQLIYLEGLNGNREP